MSIDEHHVALPKLYGAPAYARPPAPVAVTERPFDPDQLPLEFYRFDGEVQPSTHPPARVYTPAAGIDEGLRREPRGEAFPANDLTEPLGLRPRRFSLRAVAGRFLGAH